MLCVFFQNGHCGDGENCNFAHGDQELQQLPDLSKTSLCQKWLQGTCPLSKGRCRFAHGKGELRVTEAYVRRRCTEEVKAVGATRMEACQISRIARQYLLKFVPEVFDAL